MPLPSIGAQGPAHLGHAHLGHTEHAAAGRPAQGAHHCPAQDRLGHHATRFRQPNLGGHAQRFAARHGHGRAGLKNMLDKLMEENALLRQRLEGQESAAAPHGNDAVIAAREEARHRTEELARLNTLLQEARVIAKIKKDSLDWIMQNLL